MTVKVASLFDGIGGTPLSASMCGAECIWASEIEKFPIKVTEHHFSNMKHYGDITKINGEEADPVDIIVGGSPCQDLSVAGKRRGMKHSEFGDEETTRSGLFMEQIRIIKEMRSRHGANKPRYMVWENVPGAFSSNDGEDFRAVLEETARVADPTIRIPRPESWSNAGSILGDGFSISWRTFDAQYWGVPQRRRRIYLVADFRGQSAPKILFEREGLPWDTSESQDKGQGTARDVESRIRTAAFKGNQGSKSGGVWFAIECAPTLIAGQNGHVVSFVNRGHFSDGDASETLRSNCHGDVPLLFEPRSADGVPRMHGDICPTLNTMQGGQREPCVCYGIGSYHSNAMKSDNPESGFYEADTSRTLDLNGGNPCCNQGGIAVVNAYCSTVGSFMQCEAEKSPTLMARDYKDPNIVNHNKKVRRLTPLEYERLQGYPDGWTDIPGSSDSNRYKALGNSFAIPNIFYVLSGCVEQVNSQ